MSGATARRDLNASEQCVTLYDTRSIAILDIPITIPNGFMVNLNFTSML